MHMLHMLHTWRETSATCPGLASIVFVEHQMSSGGQRQLRRVIDCAISAQLANTRTALSKGCRLLQHLSLHSTCPACEGCDPWSCSRSSGTCGTVFDGLAGFDGALRFACQAWSTPGADSSTCPAPHGPFQTMQHHLTGGRGRRPERLSRKGGGGMNPVAPMYSPRVPAMRMSLWRSIMSYSPFRPVMCPMKVPTMVPPMAATPMLTPACPTGCIASE